MVLPGVQPLALPHWWARRLFICITEAGWNRHDIITLAHPFPSYAITPPCYHPSMLSPLYAITHPSMLSPLHAITPLCYYPSMPSMLPPLCLYAITTLCSYVCALIIFFFANRLFSKPSPPLPQNWFFFKAIFF